MQRANASLLISTTSWKEQFIEAVTISVDYEDDKVISCMDYFMHYLTVPWKLIFAFIPPTGEESFYLYQYNYWFLCQYFYIINCDV